MRLLIKDFDILTENGWMPLAKCGQHSNINALQLNKQQDIASFCKLDIKEIELTTGNVWVNQFSENCIPSFYKMSQLKQTHHFQQKLSTKDVLPMSPILVGAWLNRGFIEVQDKTVVFITDNAYIFNIICDELEQYGLSFTCENALNGQGQNVIVSDENLYKYFDAIKYVVEYPDFIFKLDPIGAKACIAIILDGKESKHMTVARADNLSRLAVNAGWAIIQTHQKKSNSCHVTLVTNDNESNVFTHTLSSKQKNSSLNVVLDVSKDGLYMRKDGCAFWLLSE